MLYSYMLLYMRLYIHIDEYSLVMGRHQRVSDINDAVDYRKLKRYSQKEEEEDTIFGWYIQLYDT